MIAVNVPIDAFPLVKQVFLGASEEAPIVTKGAIEAINKAELSGEMMTLNFPLVEDHGAFIACLVVGGEDNPEVDETTWNEIFVPLIRGESAPRWIAGK